MHPRGLDKALVDIVVVSYNSRELLRGCVEPLANDPEIRVVVVDNASPDQSLETVSGLDVVQVSRDSNAGFAFACNQGWRLTSAPYVLFLNPDARLAPADLRRLIAALEADERIGVIGPRIVDFDGSLVYSQRRFMDIASIWAQAFFLHHLLPGAAWTDGMIRRRARYASAGSPDWISGACMLARRRTLERLGGFDERFFMYCEDQDLCRRIRALNLDVRFEPNAVAEHAGGASMPRAPMFRVLVQSRRRYFAKYHGGVATALARIGLGAGELIRVVFTRGGRADRAGHLRGLLAAMSRAD